MRLAPIYTLLTAASLASAADWFISFDTDQACSAHTGGQGYGNNKPTGGCVNLDTATDGLHSFKWTADPCDFSAFVFYGEDCTDGGQMPLSDVCYSTNTEGARLEVFFGMFDTILPAVFSLWVRFVPVVD